MSLVRLKKNKAFPLVALDHRGSIKRLLDSEKNQDVIDWKKLALENMMPYSPAVLLDVNYGLEAYKSLKLTKPYLLAIEASGYEGGSANRKTTLKYSVKELKKRGAEAIKLLIYYNPYNKAAEHQDEIIRKVSKDCVKENIPFLLELVTYNLTGKRVSKEKLVFDSVDRVKGLEVNIDVFKLEFPGGIKTAGSKKKALENCRKLTEGFGKIPWILLSAGADYQIFKQQVDICTKGGAKGFLAGRALWQDFIKAKDLDKFFKTTVTKRLSEITKIATRNIDNF